MDYASRAPLPSVGRAPAGHFLVRQQCSHLPGAASAADLLHQLRQLSRGAIRATLHGRTDWDLRFRGAFVGSRMLGKSWLSSARTLVTEQDLRRT
jgi:hypothetical protein